MSAFTKTYSERMWGTFSFASKLITVGGIAGICSYQWSYNRISNSPAAHENAITNAGLLDPKVYDVAIIGGGIVGLATAREIRKKWPKKSIILLEKESNVARHQSGHPSGCIHAGMYYTPGTAMARLCPRGAQLLTEYCRKNKLPFDMCGKLIVATKASEEPVIKKLYENGIGNGVKGLEILPNAEAIKAKEPLVEGVMALYSKNTGMVDYGAVSQKMRDELTANPKKFSIRYNFNVFDFVGVQLPTSVVVKKVNDNGSTSNTSVPKEAVVIRGREEGQLGPEYRIVAKNVITCCGLGTDPIAKTTGVRGWWGPRVSQVYSFRGKYHQLKPEKANAVKMHIYPCPDLTKGLSVGIHISPTINKERGGNVILGPGSAFAFHPYGYSPYHVDFSYLFHSLFSYGGWVSLLTNIPTLIDTYRVDLSSKAFLKEVQKLIPSIQMDDIEESFSGVMGLGVGVDGSFCSDLALEYSRPNYMLKAKVLPKNKGFGFVPLENSPLQENCYPLVIHVRNAPSPAATASMAIAEEIVSTSSLAFMWHV